MGLLADGMLPRRTSSEPAGVAGSANHARGQAVLARRVLQLYQMREMAPSLLPVLATMLHFSPAEVAKCQEATSNAPAGETHMSMALQ